MNKPVYQYILGFCLSLALVACSKTTQIAGVASNSYSSENVLDIVEDKEILAMIKPYQKDLEKEMGEVIGLCKKDLTKALPECTLGNWMADVLQEQCELAYGQKLDFSVVNYGGIRIPTLPAGDIVMGRIFELMPFENMMVVLEVDGTIVKKLMDRVAEHGGWPMSEQVQLQIKDLKVVAVKINGKTIEDDKIYKIGMTDYIANGGDKCFFFKGQKQIQVDKLYRNALIESIRAHKTIDATIEGRVKD